MSTERSNLMAIDHDVVYPEIVAKALGLSLKQAETKDPNACNVCCDIKGSATINIGDLFTNAEATKCIGCSFLGVLICHIFGGVVDTESSFVLFPTLGGGEFLLCISPAFSRPPIFRWEGLIEVYREEGKFCPFEKIKVASHLSGDTGSEEALAKVQPWIDQCLEQHIRCRKNKDVELPTRVIDLETFSDSTDVKLITTSNKKGKYAALSHRWIDGHTITTTRANMTDRLDRIKLDDLPQTFKDAIKVVRNLGLRYLWIDSLCIIQGPDSDDWISEASKMAMVYSNAFITISSSQANATGLFSMASSDNLGGPLNVTSVSGKHKPYTVFARMPVQHRFQPIQSRGWVFQESLLSPRIVNFADNELIFECAERTVCECGVAEPTILVADPNMNHFHDSGAFGRKTTHYAALRSGDVHLLKNHWRDMIHEYTRKNLTYPSDIFPALAGLAKQMKKYRDCEYYAGLWEDTLATDLLWAIRNVGSYEEDQTVDVKGLSRPASWRAPTWSWASTVGPITWGHLGYLWKGANGSSSDCTIGTWLKDLKVEIVPEVEGDTTMGLKSGRLKLTGPLTKDVFEYNDQGILCANMVPPDWLPEDKGLETCLRLYPDYDYTIEGDDQAIHTKISSLLVAPVEYPTFKEGTQTERVYFSLLLTRVDEQKSEYKRIGLLEHDFGWHAEMTTLTLL